MKPADDVVSVSEAARELAVLRVGVGDLNAVRADRVAALRTMISEGRYATDVESVAGDVLRELLSDLLC